jgi:hypothetical protein
MMGGSVSGLIESLQKLLDQKTLQAGQDSYYFLTILIASAFAGELGLLLDLCLISIGGSSFLKLKHGRIVSYDNVTPIRRLYQGKQSISYDIAYSARSAYQGSEVMFFSDSLIQSPLAGPLQLREMLSFA